MGTDGRLTHWLVGGAWGATAMLAAVRLIGVKFDPVWISAPFAAAGLVFLLWVANPWRRG